MAPTVWPCAPPRAQRRVAIAVEAVKGPLQGFVLRAVFPPFLGGPLGGAPLQDSLEFLLKGHLHFGAIFQDQALFHKQKHQIKVLGFKASQALHPILICEGLSPLPTAPAGWVS